jgi:sugar fermentation stimulation protein A
MPRAVSVLPPGDAGVRLPPLQDGRILRRYRRFLADVDLDDGTRVTAHCPNTGSMRGCWEPGARVQVSRSDNPKRRLPWTLERVDMGGGWIGVNTALVNAVMAEAVTAGRIPSLAGYARLRREVPFQVPGLPRGRLDLGLYQGEQPDALVEIKNVTLLDGSCLRFPDAVSERGRKHLDLLLAATRQGLRGIILFALNRPEGTCFAPARDIDPAYGLMSSSAPSCSSAQPGGAGSKGSWRQKVHYAHSRY